MILLIAAMVLMLCLLIVCTSIFGELALRMVEKNGGYIR